MGGDVHQDKVRRLGHSKTAIQMCPASSVDFCHSNAAINLATLESWSCRRPRISGTTLTNLPGQRKTFL